MIDLEPPFIEEVKRILREQVADVEVWIFGSRIDGNARKYSDLDLVLVGKDKLDGRRIDALKDAFAESDLPFMVDVLDWHTLSKSFRNIIEKKYEVIQKAETIQSPILGGGRR